jgi:putative intracellular protease/amidase
MAKKDAAADAHTDEDGLVVQKYESLVLVVVPARDYAEQTLRHARSSLAVVHVGTRSVSTDYERLIKGRLQDEFMVDGPLAGESMDGYAGVIFVGGEGALELADEPDAQRLAREAHAASKLIGAWGHSVAVLARAGVVKKRRVTGAPEVRELVERAGGRFTGRQLERDGQLVTATDEAVGMRFGKTLAQIVGI